MILTDTLSGRFLCVVNTTPERLLEDIEGVNGIELLSSILPNFIEIDPYNSFSAELRPIPTGIKGEVISSWRIDIYGDDGMEMLTLTKNPTEWN